MQGQTWLHYCLAFGLSLALSLALTPLVRRYAVAKGRVALPKDNRWHRRPTALMGGVAVCAATGAAWAVAAGWMGWGVYGVPLLPVVLAGTAMFVLGLVDDLQQMAPQSKLAGQLVIAAVLIFFGFRLDWTAWPTLNLFLTIVWLVGITNAFNLLDNMDGLAAGVACIAAAFLGLLFLLNPSGSQGGAPLVLTLALLGAVLGFLVYNFNPASIFMGDAGSLFIGFVLASISMTHAAPSAHGGGFLHLVSVIAVPVLILFVPILDTGFVSVMRKLFHRRISQGGKDHSSHRLVAIGLSEKRAVLVLYGFAGASGCIALAIHYLGLAKGIVLMVLYLLFVVFFWVYLAGVKVYQEKSILETEVNSGVTPLLVDVTYRRHLVGVMLDLVLIAVAYYSAYLLRFEGVPGPNFDFFLKSLPILIACQIVSFYLFGVYRGVWKSTGVHDLITYSKALTVGTVGTMLILLFAYRFVSFSRAVFVIYWILMLIMVSLSRLSFRMLEEGLSRSSQAGIPTLIYGAGVGGQMALKEILNNRSLGLKMVGFIDDDPLKRHRSISGYPIFGGRKVLEEVLRKHGVRQIIISFKEDRSARRQEIKRVCAAMGVEVEVRQMRLDFV